MSRAVLTVLLIEDQPLMRRGLRMMLEFEDDLQVVGEAATGEAGVELALALEPDVVLMDLHLPGISGVEATQRLRGAGSGTPVLVLTTFDSEDHVLDAVEAGAAGFLLKDVEADELTRVIRKIAAGEHFIQASVAALVLLRAAKRRQAAAADTSSDLSARELEVLNLLATGLGNKAIARQLDVAESTVKSHVNSILSKLQVRNRTQAALKARREYG